jgi:hypothetical protein
VCQKWDANACQLMQEPQLMHEPQLVRFWGRVDQFYAVQNLCSEWIVAAQIVSTVVSGGVADETVFSGMKFV